MQSALARLLTVSLPVASALALAACASAPAARSAPAPVVTALQAPVGGAAAQTQPVMASSSVATPLGGGSIDPNSPLGQQRSVYFAFDESSYRSQDKAVVELQGNYLAQHPDVHVSIAGNTDDRGGSEYNLALGQRRAQSVKTALGLLGVKDAQVEAVSYGKEKPRATGHDEAAWQQNRRADFVYPSK